MKHSDPQTSLRAKFGFLVAIVLAFQLTGTQSISAAIPHTQPVLPFWQDDDVEENEWVEEERENEWVDEEEENEWQDQEEGDWEEDEREEESWDEEEGDWEEENEFEFAEIEFERASVEMNIGRLEVITRLTEIAESETSMAGYAIMHIGEFLEADEAIELLEEVKSSDRAPRSVRNLAKMKLAEMYVEEDRVDDVKKILRSLLMFR